jgi:hypothetical protein
MAKLTPAQKKKAQTQTSYLSSYNMQTWAEALLTALGVPVTLQNVINIMSWENAEGQWGATGKYNASQMHNPLNINTTDASLMASWGAGVYNMGGTNFFPTWKEGFNATIATMNRNFPSVVAALRKGNLSTAQFEGVVSSTGWASSHYPGGWTIVKPGGKVGKVAVASGPSLSGVANALTGGAYGDVKSVATAIGWLWNKNNLKRVGEVVLGGGLIVTGIVFIAKETGVSVPSPVQGAFDVGTSLVPGGSEIGKYIRGSNKKTTIHVGGGIKTTKTTNRRGNKEFAEFEKMPPPLPKDDRVHHEHYFHAPSWWGPTGSSKRPSYSSKPSSSKAVDFSYGEPV